MQDLQALIYYSSSSILIFLVAAKVCKNSVLYRLSCSFIFATLTFAVIVFYPALVPFRFSDQSLWFEYIHKHRCSFYNERENKILGSYTFVNIVRESETCADITSPGHAREFFSYLKGRIDSGDKKCPIDLVVVDAIFSERFTREIDTVCLQLMKTGKVLFAFEEFEKEGVYTKQNFLDYSCLGTIAYIKKEEQFIDFNLSANIQSLSIPSLPYLAYLTFLGKTSSRANALLLKERVKGSAIRTMSDYATNNFIPDLYPEIADSMVVNRNLFNLNEDLIYDGGSGTNHLRAFERRLLENRRLHIPNVLVIGSFKNDESDVHKAISGSMHGSVIMTSIFTSLLLERHKQALVFFIALYFGLFLIYLFLIHRAITPAYEEPGPGKFLRKFTLTYFMHDLFRFIVVQMAGYWIWALLFLFVYMASGHLINITSLVYLSFLLEKSFKAIINAGNYPDSGGIIS